MILEILTYILILIGVTGLLTFLIVLSIIHFIIKILRNFTNL